MAKNPGLSGEIAVAGHICLDVIPAFEARGAEPVRFTPGSLIHVGPAIRSAGGAVANAGLALHRLGAKVRLMGKIGDDLFGDELFRILRSAGPELGEGMIVSPGQPTSYSIVLNPPGSDRLFLHCPGVNDVYAADDIDAKSLENVGIFHFGYPPIMKRMYADGGIELAALLRRARFAGAATSLDMCAVDAASPAGKVDWQALLRRALPEVDFFVPSYDEIAAMLRMEPAPPGAQRLSAIAEQLIGFGAAVVLLKLGDEGVYLRSTDDVDRLARIGLDATWIGREMISPCFQVNVAGTTGSGDCTIAGFLAAVNRGENPQQAVIAATAVGACSVETMDATSGVRPWTEVRRRIDAGWPRHRPTMNLDEWRADAGVFFGPNDSTNK